MGKPTTKTEVLKTVRNEIKKEHIDFDILGRVSKTYLAPAAAVNGDPCIVIEYIYYGSSTAVKGRTEGYGFWDSVFDNIDDPNTDNLLNDLGVQLVDDFNKELLGPLEVQQMLVNESDDSLTNNVGDELSTEVI